MSGQVETQTKTVLPVQEQSQVQNGTPTYAVCKECGEVWNISRYQQLPVRGYICPYCTNKTKQQIHNQKQNQKQGQKEIAKRIITIAIEYLIVTIIGIVIYLNIAQVLELERGYKAYGGECLILLLPYWWFILSDLTKKITKEKALHTLEQ